MNNNNNNLLLLLLDLLKSTLLKEYFDLNNNHLKYYESSSVYKRVSFNFYFYTRRIVSGVSGGSIIKNRVERIQKLNNAMKIISISLGILEEYKQKKEQQEKDIIHSIITKITREDSTDSFQLLIQQPQTSTDVDSQLKKLSQYYLNLKRMYGMPPIVFRIWIPVTVSLSALYILSKNTKSIYRLTTESYKTINSLVLNWIYEPLKGIYKTIRYEHSINNSQMSYEVDLESLGRMVSNYSTSNNNDKDFSLILLQYEQEMQHPLRNLLAGDLIQLILIQIQKAKVDVELALSALDKILKSNELNFGLVAVAPVLMIFYFVVVNGLLLLSSKSSGGRRFKRKRIKQLLQYLRQIEVLLLRKQQPSYYSTGQIVVLSNLMMEQSRLRWSKYIFTTERMEMLQEDLKELQLYDLDSEVKLKVAERLWRYVLFAAESHEHE
ncbi:hypothetical protein MP638_001361 [Amoeboaphelidium occidentale]|nr:hypothetical protein MP638_001361 [Amoeboaphelidium occidentale]